MSDGTGSDAAVTSLFFDLIDIPQALGLTHSIHSNKISEFRLDGLSDRTEGFFWKCLSAFTTRSTVKFKVSGSGCSRNGRRMSLE